MLVTPDEINLIPSLEHKTIKIFGSNYNLPELNLNDMTRRLIIIGSNNIPKINGKLSCLEIITDQIDEYSLNFLNLEYLFLDVRKIDKFSCCGLKLKILYISNRCSMVAKGSFSNTFADYCSSSIINCGPKITSKLILSNSEFSLKSIENTDFAIKKYKTGHVHKIDYQLDFPEYPIYLIGDNSIIIPKFNRLGKVHEQDISKILMEYKDLKRLGINHLKLNPITVQRTIFGIQICDLSHAIRNPEQKKIYFCRGWDNYSSDELKNYEKHNYKSDLFSILKLIVH